MSDMITFTAPQLKVIKDTVAKDTNQTEFNLFLEACRSYGLDPFRKQIHAVVYSKDNPDKRKMTIIVSRDGLRVLAHRCRDYRPASEPAQIIYDVDHKGPTNPKGIVSATVRLWKQDNRGEWYPVIGEAYWDEYAPVADEWAFDEESRKRKPTGKKTLDASGNWAKMPIVMITKCAESQALRAGWPETFGNIHAEEEMERVTVAATASEALEAHERADREAKTGGRGVLMVFDDAMKLEKVPMGSVADRVAEFIETQDPADVYKFRVRNEDALREFWTAAPTDALALKRAFEAKERLLPVASNADA
jgi:phage recombination protein Bet